MHDERRVEEGKQRREDSGSSGLVVKATSEDHEVHGSSPGLTLREDWHTHLIYVLSYSLGSSPVPSRVCCCSRT